MPGQLAWETMTNIAFTTGGLKELARRHGKTVDWVMQNFPFLTPAGRAKYEAFRIAKEKGARDARDAALSDDVQRVMNRSRYLREKKR